MISKKFLGSTHIIKNMYNIIGYTRPIPSEFPISITKFSSVLGPPITNTTLTKLSLSMSSHTSSEPINIKNTK